MPKFDKAKGFSAKFMSKSPFKDIIRGLGPHNPGHKAAGDDSNAAHGTDAFKGAQAEWDAKQKASAEKRASNPNREQIDALRAELRTLDDFDEADAARDAEIRAQLKKLRSGGGETNSPTRKTGDMHGQAMEIGTVTTRG